MELEEVIKEIQRVKSIYDKYNINAGIIVSEKAINVILQELKNKDNQIQELQAVNKMQEYRINEMDIPKKIIEEFIKSELPDDEICSICDVFDVNGIEIKQKLQELLGDKNE